MKALNRIIAITLILTLSLGGVVCTAESFWDWAKGAADEVLGWAQENAEEALDWAGSAADEALDWAGGAADDAWNWAVGAAAAAGDTASEIFGAISEFVLEYGDEAIEGLRGIYDDVCEDIGIASEAAAELWNSIDEYAAKNDITFEKLETLVIALLSGEYTDGQLEELRGDAQGLWKVIEKWLADNGITYEAAADASLESLAEVLAG